MIKDRINFFRINGVILTLLLTAWVSTVSAEDECDEQPILDLAGLGIAGT